jgi:hypothetical protein
MDNGLIFDLPPRYARSLQNNSVAKSRKSPAAVHHFDYGSKVREDSPQMS